MKMIWRFLFAVALVAGGYLVWFAFQAAAPPISPGKMVRKSLFSNLPTSRNSAGFAPASARRLAPATPVAAGPSTAAGASTTAGPDPNLSSGKSAPSEAVLEAALQRLYPRATWLVAEEWKEVGGIRLVAIVQPEAVPYPIRAELAVGANDSLQLVSEMVANEVLIGRPEGLSAANFEQAWAGVEGAELVPLARDLGIYKVRILGEPDPAMVSCALAVLAENAEGLPWAYAEPNRIVRAQVTPEDPAYAEGSLWGLHNTGQFGGVEDADIDAPEVWEIRREAGNVVVSVIDTGVRYTHEDLVGNLWTNPGEIPANGVDDDNNGYVDDVYGINAITNTGDPLDDNGHGTHCSGTIAARGNNGVGSTGVAWSAKIMGLKFLGADGYGSTSDAIKCIDYSRIMGAQVSSNSWGGGSMPTGLDDEGVPPGEGMAGEALTTAIRAATATGQIFVAAAGNSTSNNDTGFFYPANTPSANLLTVAATDRTDEIAYFSSYGAGRVHLGAPGVDIYSLDYQNNSAYSTKSGTSMATPHVTGAVTLLRAQFPSDTPGQVLNRLLRGADRIPALAGKALSGARLNVAQAFTADPRPLHDDLAEAIVLPSMLHNVVQMTVAGATAESSNVQDGIANGQAVWFRYSSGDCRFLRVSTEGSSFDTAIGIYYGTSVGSLVPVATNDNAAPGVVTSLLETPLLPERDYYIAVTSQGAAEGYLQLTLTAPPPNDAFADAIAIASPVGDEPSVKLGGNIGATFEAEEPATGPAPVPGEYSPPLPTQTVWWKWTADRTGPMQISTQGSSFNTILWVFAGSTLQDLVSLGMDDNSADGSAAMRYFAAVEGTTYYFRVAGQYNSSGDIRISLAPGVAAPANDNFAEAESFPAFDEAGVAMVSGASNVGATPEVSEPTYACANTVWWKWVADENILIETSLSGYFGGVVDIYSGTQLGTLASVTSGSFFTVARFRAQVGQTYYFRVSGSYSANPDIILQLRKIYPPANDHFAGAAQLADPAPGQTTMVYGTNMGASLETGEPATTDNATGTVWWRWTASRTGWARLDTAFSNIDTLLYIYTGSALETLTEVAFDDDSGSSWGCSGVTFSVVEGTVYYIRVAGKYDSAGAITLSLAYTVPPPSNDNFADAAILANPLPGEATTVTGTNLGATKEATEDDLEYDLTKTVWWKWEADRTGPMRVDTAGSDFATLLWVIEAASPFRWQLAYDQKSFNGTTNSLANFAAEEGKTYYFRVAGVADAAGSIQLTLRAGTPAPVNDNYAQASTLPNPAGLAPSIVTGSHLGATMEADEPLAEGYSTTVWWKWVADRSATMIVDVRSSNFPAQVWGFRGSDLSALNTMGTSPAEGRLRFEAIEGQTYYFRVSGPFQADAEITLSLAQKPPLANDHFAGATALAGPIPGQVTTVYGENAEATVEPEEPYLSYGHDRTVWWKWEADRSGFMRVDTVGSTFDTILWVFSGSTLGALNYEAWSDDADGASTSAVDFLAVAGRTYYFRVAGYNFATGDITLSLRESAQAFGLWMAHAAPLLDGTDAAPGADPDWDGLNNLLEYARGTDPTMADGAEPFTSVGLEGAGASRYLRLSFTPMHTTGLRFFIESSEDLVTWPENGRREVTAAVRCGVVNHFTDTEPVSQRRFLRLRMVQP